MDKQTGWKETAIHNSVGCWKEFISSRVELALERVSRKAKYMGLCRKQRENEETVRVLLDKLDKGERVIIQRYYEGETAKEGYELDEAYIQGLKDGIRFLLWIDVSGVKDWMQE